MISIDHSLLLLVPSILLSASIHVLFSFTIELINLTGFNSKSIKPVNADCSSLVVNIAILLYASWTSFMGYILRQPTTLALSCRCHIVLGDCHYLRPLMNVTLIHVSRNVAYSRYWYHLLSFCTPIPSWRSATPELAFALVTARTRTVCDLSATGSGPFLNVIAHLESV